MNHELWIGELDERRINMPRSNNHGFTLVEILIVMAIMAGVMAFAAATVGGAGNQVRKTSFEIVRAIRYVYDTTLINHQYQRLVIDLDAQKISVEYSENPYFVRQETEENQKLQKEKEEQEEEIPEVGEEIDPFADEETNPIETIEKPVQAEFVSVEDDLFAPYQLSKSARIMDVFIEHQMANLEEGIAYLYFFPKGYTEFAVIHLGNEDGEKNMTLIVNPLSGAVEVRDGYVEVEEVEEEMKSE